MKDKVKDWLVVDGRTSQAILVGGATEEQINE